MKGDSSALKAFVRAYDGRPEMNLTNETILRLLEFAANEKNCSTAQIKLGVVYCQNRITRHDFAKAVRLLEIARMQGDPDHLYPLACALYYGHGNIEQDAKEAERLFKLALDRGSSDAAHSLGIMYQEGAKDVEKNVPESVRMYKMALDLGFTRFDLKPGIRELIVKTCSRTIK